MPHIVEFMTLIIVDLVFLILCVVDLSLSGNNYYTWDNCLSCMFHKNVHMQQCTYTQAQVHVHASLQVLGMR